MRREGTVPKPEFLLQVSSVFEANIWYQYGTILCHRKKIKFGNKIMFTKELNESLETYTDTYVQYVCISDCDIMRFARAIVSEKYVFSAFLMFFEKL